MEDKVPTPEEINENFKKRAETAAKQFMDSIDNAKATTRAISTWKGEESGINGEVCVKYNLKVALLEQKKLLHKLQAEKIIVEAKTQGLMHLQQEVDNELNKEEDKIAQLKSENDRLANDLVAKRAELTNLKNSIDKVRLANVGTLNNCNMYDLLDKDQYFITAAAKAEYFLRSLFEKHGITLLNTIDLNQTQ